MLRIYINFGFTKVHNNYSIKQRLKINIKHYHGRNMYDLNFYFLM